MQPDALPTTSGSVLDPVEDLDAITLDGDRDETLKHLCCVHQFPSNRGRGDGCYAEPHDCMSPCGIRRRPNFRELPYPSGPYCVVCWEWWQAEWRKQRA